MATMTYDVNATTTDGVTVPVKITLDYPDDHGLTAVKALEHLIRENYSALIHALASQGDLSLVKAMERAGIAFDDEDDDFDE